MPLSDIFQNIEQLKRELDSYRPLPNNILNTLNYRLRLELSFQQDGRRYTFHSR